MSADTLFLNSTIASLSFEYSGTTSLPKVVKVSSDNNCDFNANALYSAVLWSSGLSEANPESISISCN